MNSRERVTRSLTFQTPDGVPRHLWRLPGVKMFRHQDTDRILSKYPEDITILEFNYAPGKKTKGTRYIKGQVGIDEWCCPWYVWEDGVAGEVKDTPLKSLSDIKKLTAPYEIL